MLCAVVPLSPSVEMRGSSEAADAACLSLFCRSFALCPWHRFASVPPARPPPFSFQLSSVLLLYPTSSTDPPSSWYLSRLGSLKSPLDKLTSLPFSPFSLSPPPPFSTFISPFLNLSPSTMLFTKAVSSVVGATVLAAAAVSAQSSSSVPPFQYGTPNPDYPGVKSTARNGPTNPSSPQLNTPINQTSTSRLASINSVDDWCTFGPPGTGQPLADVEEITVAYCTKPRNNARVIPDGSVTGAHFVKTPLYVQLMAVGDFTSIGFMAGDEGGELDPHGATGMGNPIGGNVTSNVSGEDVFYEEWMNYASANQICFRVCIAGTDVAPTALECQHTLDVMGCNWVMPGNYNDGVFETCDGDSAYPPGLYPEGNGQTSTFVQYFTGVYSVNGVTYSYTNGSPDESTPQVAYSTPATSNCKTTSTIANGIKSLVASHTTSSSSMAKSTGTASAASASNTGSSSGSSSSGSSSGSSGSSGSSSGSSGSSNNGSAAKTSGASKLTNSASAAVLAFAAVIAGAMML